MEYAFSLKILIDHVVPLLKGLQTTLLLSGAIIALATVEGLILCLARLSGIGTIVFCTSAFIEIFRNVPRIVLILWVYYSSAIYFKIDFITPWLAAFWALGVQQGAFMAEIFRAGIESVDKGEIEAGRSIALSYFQIMRRIVLPQAVRVTIPAFTNQIVMAIKTTTIASVVGVTGLLYWTNNLSMVTFHPIEFYLGAAVIFFVICWGISQLANYFNDKLMIY
jgi:His/Glu/Gln/Arg/opine family amino acid ABC transporter permease subunit